MKRHPSLTIALHWGTAVAIVVAVAAMFLRDATDDKALRQFLLDTHRQLGVMVLIAAGLRVLTRVRSGLAEHAPSMAVVLRWASKVAHVVLYGFLIALPFTGWAVTSAHGITLSVLGQIPLPALVASDSELADTLSDYHVWLAWGLLGFVGLHAAAALWHHYVRRDSVLTAMLPSRTAQRSLPAGVVPDASK